MGRDPAEILPQIAFMAAVAFRVMPSFNRFLSSVQSIRFSVPVIELIKQQLDFVTPNRLNIQANELSFCSAIKIEKLSFNYEAGKRIIDDVSLKIEKGKKIGLVGSSGAGKSTFVDLILGLHEPLAGKITVDGVNISLNLRGWQNILGYVPQNIFLSDNSLKANIAFGVSENEVNTDDLRRAIRLAQLDGLVNELGDGVETLLGERGVRLSGGQRQRIGIARALYHNPKLLILDEATSALDGEIEKEVMKRIYALDSTITVIIITRINIRRLTFFFI